MYDRIKGSTNFMFIFISIFDSRYDYSPKKYEYQPKNITKRVSKK